MKNYLLKTVYSLYYPETKRITSQLFSNSSTLDLYEKSFDEPKIQTQSHIYFRDAWLKWSAPQVKGINLKNYTFYNTAGSSEAIRESLAHYAAGGGKFIFTFKGEYEGYKALAEGYGIQTIEIDRNNWKELAQDSIRYPFYISQPSSIDGNIWEDFSLFLDFMKKTQPNAKIRLDLCYLGTTLEPLEIDLTSSNNVDMIFFSLSKVFGVYFHRIGGVFSRNSMMGLEGNRWFKNLFSLHLGTKLLQTYSIDYFPKKYAQFQNKIIDSLNQNYQPIIFYPSDVIILAYSETGSEHVYEDLKSMKRHSNYRYCLTSYLDFLINNKEEN